MKRTVLAIVALLFIVTNIKAQERKEIIVHKNGDILYNNILSSLDSIKFSTSESSRWLHYIQNGIEVETIDISEIDSIKFVVIDQHKNFYEDCTEGSEVVEIEHMGEKILCNYVNGLYIIQGDIIIKDDNIEIDTNLTEGMNRKAAMATGTNLWTEGKVYYHYSHAIPPTWSALIASEITPAMYKISAINKNIKFIPLYTDEAIEYRKNRRIVFVANTDTNNSSNVGMQKNAQILYLDINFPSALHEICHAIGLEHEHSRPDRDKYININYSNIRDEAKYNFNKFNTMKYYSPTSELDLASIMIYPSYNTFAIDITKPTMTEKNGFIFCAQRAGLTYNDIHVINQMYPKLPIVSPDIIIHNKNIQPTINSCELTGELIYEGDPKVSVFGICYRDSTNLFGICYSDSTNSTSYIYQASANKNDSGVYKCLLTNLKPKTTYIAAAYVVQNNDTIYSKTVDFTTLAPIWRLDADVIINGVTQHYSSDVFLDGYPNTEGGTACMPDFVWTKMSWSNPWRPTSGSDFRFTLSTTTEALGLPDRSWGNDICIWMGTPLPMKIGDVSSGSISFSGNCFYGSCACGMDGNINGGTFTLTKIE
jgi:hypothetical protein